MDNELNEAAGAVFEALVECLPNEEAAASIRAKPAMLPATYRKLLPELKARAFTVVGIERADVLQRIRDRIADLPQGVDWNAVKRDILADLGPSFVDETADEETQAKQQAAAERRAELLIRHHGFQAYQAGMFDLLERQKDAFPYWQYITVDDERVRDEHRALHGLILPADSPFWDDHFPPWDWGCRCQVAAIDREEFEEIAARSGGPGATPAGDPRVLSDVELRELEQNGRLFLSNGQTLNVAAPQGEGALHWNPRELRIPLEDLRKSYDKEVFARFAEDMRSASVTLGDGERVTAWDWLLDPPRDAARQKLLAGARSGKEVAAAVNWDTGEELSAQEGTVDSVEVAGMIQAARKAGTRISIEHGHTPGGLDLPSPRDVATLAANADVVAQIGVHVPWFRHTIRLSADVSEQAAKRLAKRLLADAQAVKDGTMTPEQWIAKLTLYIDNGVLRYERRIGR